MAGGLDDAADDECIVAAAVVVVAISSNSPEASANSSHPLALRTLDPPSRRAKADARASKMLFIEGLARGKRWETRVFDSFFRPNFLWRERASREKKCKVCNLLFFSR